MWTLKAMAWPHLLSPQRKPSAGAKRGASFIPKILLFYLCLKAKPKGLYYNHFNTISPQCSLVGSFVKKKGPYSDIHKQSWSLEPFNVYQQSSLICLFSSAKLPLRVFTGKLPVIPELWMQDDYPHPPFLITALISWEQFCEAEEQSKKRGLGLRLWLRGCNLWQSDSLPWQTSHIRPRRISGALWIS